MKQITINGFAFCKPAESWESEKDANVRDGFAYSFCRSSMIGVKGYIHVGTAQVTIDVPDDFDPRAGAVEALTEQKQKLMAEFHARIADIDRQISQFTAIEYVEVA